MRRVIHTMNAIGLRLTHVGEDILLLKEAIKIKQEFDELKKTNELKKNPLIQQTKKQSMTDNGNLTLK